MTADPLGAITLESEGHREYRCAHTTGLNHTSGEEHIMDSGSDSASRYIVHLCFEIQTSCYQRYASHGKNETGDELKILLHSHEYSNYEKSSLRSTTDVQLAHISIM